VGSRALLDAVRLVPVTDAQRNALAGTGDGDLVYNSDRQQMEQRASGLWVPASGALGGGNLLINSSFEYAPGALAFGAGHGWEIAALSPIMNVGSAAAQISDGVNGSLQCAGITPHTTTNNTGITQAVTPEGAPIGSKFTFSVWLKSNGYNSTVQIAARDMANAVEADSGAITLTSAWKRYAVTLTCGAGVIGDIVVSIQSFSHGTGQFLADNAQLEFGDQTSSWRSWIGDVVNGQERALGEMARTVSASNQGIAAITEFVITTLATTFFALPTRKYRILVTFNVRDLSAGCHITLRVKDGTTQIEGANAWNHPATAVNRDYGYTRTADFSPSLVGVGSASHTINVTMQSDNAAGLTSLIPSSVQIDDVGTQ